MLQLSKASDSLSRASATRFYPTRRGSKTTTHGVVSLVVGPVEILNQDWLGA